MHPAGFEPATFNIKLNILHVRKNIRLQTVRTTFVEYGFLEKTAY